MPVWPVHEEKHQNSAVHFKTKALVQRPRTFLSAYLSSSYPDPRHSPERDVAPIIYLCNSRAKTGIQDLWYFVTHVGRRSGAVEGPDAQPSLPSWLETMTVPLGDVSVGPESGPGIP